MNIPINKYIKLLSKYLEQEKLQIMVLALLMGGKIALQLINPQIVRYFIDETTKGKYSQNLLIAAVIFIAAAFIQQLLAIISTYLSQNVGWNATNALRLDLVKHCIGLDMTFFKEHESGEIVERIDGDVTALFNFFAELLVNFSSNVLLIVGIIILLLIEDIRIGFAFTAFSAAALVIMGKSQGATVDDFKKNRETTAKFYGFLGEHIGSTEDIKANGASNYVMDKFYSTLQKWLPINLKANLGYYKLWISLEGIFAVGYAIIFGLGGYLWYKGKVTIGTVYLMLNYIQLLEKPLEELRTQMQDMQKASASIIRVEELLSTKSKLQDGKGEGIKEDTLSLNMQNVYFEYDKDSPVLNNISFKLSSGKVLGILGRTGSGKTTLARLIVRFYDAKSGEICINGIELKTIPIKSLREHIAYVTQDVQLFNASVRDNLTFFNDEINDETIINTIYDMGLQNWYEGLSEGLDTILQPSGGGMSAGEAQLLALARVFLRNPGLIILDEASSRLDSVTEKMVDKALNKLIEGRSCIIIAHRLSTIKKADEILILDKGSVLEYGKRTDLANDEGSRFNELLRCGAEEWGLA